MVALSKLEAKALLKLLEIMGDMPVNMAEILSPEEAESLNNLRDTLSREEHSHVLPS